MAIHKNCHLIAIMGGKGGVGKSVFSANFACALMMELRARVLLMDLDPKSCGDQNVITGLRPQKTVADLANFNNSITPQALNSIVTKHQSGLHFIGAVESPDQNLEVSASVLRRQLFPVSQHYQFIVADLGSGVHELQLSLLEDVSAGIVVTTPEVLVINQTRKFMNELLSATVPQELLQVVVNRSSKNALNPQAISQSLKRPIVGSIPTDDSMAYSSLQKATPFVLSSPNSQITSSYHNIVRKLTGGTLQKLKAMTRPSNMQTKGSSSSEVSSSSVPESGASEEDTDYLTKLKMQIHSGLIKEMDLKKDLTNSKGDPQKEKQLREKTQRVISQLADKVGQGMSREERSNIIKQVTDEALGLGPLEDLLGDPKVSEIMVNGAKQIYVERNGKLTVSQVTFTSNLQLRNVIERIVTPLGRRIDEKTPYVDARLQDGSRVNAVIEPLAIDGPALTIRKFPQDTITAEDYVDRFGSLTQPMADFLKVCVEQGLNIVISGGTGSGKTTLLNVLSGFIPTNERIITVEDAAELQLKQDHVVRLETRPANMEGTGAITIRDLVKNSLRMRPDRIVVGECRDGAALDMLSAMNTGHDGSMTTVHSNTPREAVSRLETLCLMAGMELPVRAIREQIAGAVHLIVQIGRLSDGSRKITSITEVVGMQGEAVTQQEIFRFKEEGFDKNRKIVGSFQAMGLIPTFIEKFEQRGVTIPRNLFTSSGSASGGSGGSGQPSGGGSTKGARPAPIRRSGPSKIKKPGTVSGQNTQNRPKPVKKASGESSGRGGQT